MRKALLLLSILLVALVLIWQRSRPPKGGPALGAPPVESAASARPAGRAPAESEATKRARAFSEAVVAAHREKLLKEDPRDVAAGPRRFVASAESWLKLRQSLFREEYQSEIFRRAESEPGAKALARRVLVDHDHARAVFGDKQALARVFAIDFLVHLAREREGADLLRDSIVDLSGQLQEEYATLDKVPEGRLADLEELILGYTSANPDAVLGSLAKEMAALNYSPMFRRQYSAGVGAGLQGRRQEHFDRQYVAFFFPERNASKP